MDDFTCPWCGEDLSDLLESMRPTSYDAVFEAHVMECEPWLREQGMLDE